ncbi:dicarboxylate/amino acid:cation symporter [Bengtsoniella intestinalis]|uniref:dicarboxylate/amino acid:cation symporter n=1 Tax=Bengtsoniella intestinalis TaxID=3073143 RepID=UPI00391F8B03
MKKTSLKESYGLLALMMGGMILGTIVGAMWPGATMFKPLGQIFINLMFCIVIPMVFASISSAVANMKNRKRAGKILGTTVATFVVTGLFAGAVMFILVKIFPPVLTPWQGLEAVEMSAASSVGDLIVGFFTAENFVTLIGPSSMLPLIVFSVLFGLSVNLAGESGAMVARGLESVTACMLQMVKIVTYYAPIAFFGIFANLVATYSAEVISDYARALLLYYPLCFVYIFTAWPLFAWIGAGKLGVKTMMQNIARPAVTSLGTCSSVATIPTNMEVANKTGIPKDVSEMVLPLGATMHMDGSCFSCVLKITFLFGVFGKDLGIENFFMIMLVAVLSSVGMSGVPGGGYIGELIMCSIFFPDQIAFAYPIAVVIGNLVDPPATMINSAGDYVVSFMVARVVDGKDWLEKAVAAKEAE